MIFFAVESVCSKSEFVSRNKLLCTGHTSKAFLV